MRTPKKFKIFRTVAALTAVVVLMPGTAASAAPPSPTFGPAIDGYASNDPQDTCDPNAKPGVLDFRNLLVGTYGNRDINTIERPCSAGGTSEHKEGRALDFGFDINNSTQRAQASDLLNWLLATDGHGNRHALARRLGIMYLIWNRQIWSAARQSEGWRSYGCDGSPSDCHTNHIHFSFSWAGARKQTTWWTGRITPMTNSGVGAVMDGSVLRVFARGADGALWQDYWNGSRWTWQEIGGGISYGPSAVVYNGVLRVFARGNDGALWQATWANGAWSWQDLGGSITSSPSAVFWGGALRVFARGADGALWQAIMARETWTWHEVGGGISGAPSAVVHGTTLRVFARGNDGALWQGYTANGGNWTWQDLGGGIASGPSAVMHGTTLRVFARGQDGSLWQNYWNGSEWAWQDLGGTITGAPSAVMHGTVLRVFARAADGALWQNYWNGSTWTWQDLGGGIT